MVTVPVRPGQELLDELTRMVDRASWALSGQRTVPAVAAEAQLLAASTALRAAGAQPGGQLLDDQAGADPHADLAAAAGLCQQLPRELAEHRAVLAAAAHLRQADRLLAE